MRSESRLGLLVLSVLAAAALLAPALAGDRPLLARIDGRLAAPALADIPVLGRLVPAGPAIDWDPSAAKAPGRASVRILLMPPIPWSYRGIHLEEALRPPSAAHPMGTDALGRDLCARVLHGARTSFIVGFGATALAAAIGFLCGALAGLRGGTIDLVLVRLTDVAACFPPFVLALAFMAAAGTTGVGSMIAAIALSRWTTLARYVRGEILRRRGGDVWTGARAAGATGTRVVLRHLLPLLAAPLAVLVAFGVANAIVLEAGLSFLGFGVAPPAPSWGSLLAEARGTLGAAWWPVFFPAAALLAALASLCAVAEGVAERPSSRPGISRS